MANPFDDITAQLSSNDDIFAATEAMAMRWDDLVQQPDIQPLLPDDDSANDVADPIVPPVANRGSRNRFSVFAEDGDNDDDDDDNDNDDDDDKSSDSRRRRKHRNAAFSWEDADSDEEEDEEEKDDDKAEAESRRRKHRNIAAARQAAEETSDDDDDVQEGLESWIRAADVLEDFRGETLGYGMENLFGGEAFASMPVTKNELRRAEFEARLSVVSA